MKRMNGFQFAASVMHSSSVDELMECMKEDAAKADDKCAAPRPSRQPLLPIWQETGDVQRHEDKRDEFARAA